MKTKQTRYEINQKIKRVLVSHGTDLQQFFFSFSGKAASFTGRLCKVSGQDMKHEEVETLCKLLSNIPEIIFLNFELEDWVISSGSGSFSITRKQITSSAPAREQEPLFIQTDETVKDVLKDS
ncbi:MAG: hypothetical protein HUK40_08760 [Desulfobacter sp.]|nr:hypothetical protein [Desulfobacter sp.]